MIMSQPVTPPDSEQPEQSSSGTRPVAVAMVIVALAGYVVLMVASRLMPLEENTAFLTFWSLQFFCFGILSGLQNEITRAIRQRRSGPAEEGHNRAPASSRCARALPVGLTLGGIEALVILLLLPWGPQILGEGRSSGIAVVALGIVLYAGHCATNGALAGTGRWRLYGTLLSFESLLRLGLVASLLLVFSGHQVLSAELGTALAAGAWIVLICLSTPSRRALRACCDRSFPAMLSSAGRAMAGGIGNAVLLVGFPVLLSLTTPAAEYASAAPFILAISLTRAPIMMPLTAFQGVVITRFIDAGDRRNRMLVTLMTAISAIAALGAVLAALIGPWLMQVLFGPGYRVSSLTLGLLTLSAGLIAFQTVLGALLVAVSRQSSYAIGWIVSAAVCAVILLAPGSMETRALWAILVGTGSGTLTHWAMLGRFMRASTRSSHR